MKWSGTVALLWVLGFGVGRAAVQGTGSVRGILHDAEGRPMAEAALELRSAAMRADEAPLLRHDYFRRVEFPAASVFAQAALLSKRLFEAFESWE
jgi:hypothetical protein